jgi:hypothetical protein
MAQTIRISSQRESVNGKESIQIFGILVKFSPKI